MTPVRSIIILSFVAWGCSTGSHRVALIEGMQLFDSLLPVVPDSVISLYGRFDPSTFYTTYTRTIAALGDFIDSMNGPLPEAMRIDTLAVDHSIENIGNAARAGRTIFLSSSYFFLYPDTDVLRSVVTHEYGHIYYSKLDDDSRADLQAIWEYLQQNALFYLFRDGEYSGNARFGGHPYDSPSELFASAYNIFRHRSGEFAARLLFVDARHHPHIESLRDLIRRGTLSGQSRIRL